MATLVFDPTSVANRVLANVTAKLQGDGITNAKIFYYGPMRRVIDAFSEEEANAMQYDEYLTRETSWNIAQNSSSLMSKTQFFLYRPHRRISARGQLKVSSSPTFGGTWPRSVQIPRWKTFSNGQHTYICVGNSGSAYLLDPLSQYIYISVAEGVPRSVTFQITLGAFPNGTDYAVLNVADALFENTMYDVLVNGVLWTEIDNLRLSTDGTSTVFSTRTALDFSSVDFLFGNNFFGKGLSVGDVVTIRYAQSSAGAGDVLDINNVTQVVDAYLDAGGFAVTLYCKNDASLEGGQDVEDLESIRANAPYSYQAGNRAISKNDYETLIKKSNIVQYVIAWGEAEANIDAGLPAGTFIAASENLVFLSAFNVDAASGLGIMATSSQQDSIRSALNPIKGLTDIIQFKDTDFIYVSFTSSVYVSDSRYSLSSVQSAVGLALTTGYALGKLAYHQSLYRSQYNALISAVAGVDHHVTTVSLAKLIQLSSAYVFTHNLGILNVKPGSLVIAVKGGEYAAWTTVATDVGALSTDTVHAIAASAGFTVSAATITYATGAIGSITILSGLAQAFGGYSIRIQFGLMDSEQNDVKLTSRLQIIAFYQAVITPLQV